ncbi:MAG: glycerol-3-phosphate acyltransferase [Dictyoglomaceae bacterium]|nr:glycerol-3-phosphate acyltransferase [Dictyoglomaceae bacterium]
MWINILAIILQFFSGSIMYSYIIAKFLRVDLSKIRDGNPGSTNLWRAVGWKYGILALALDYLKGVFPISLFIIWGLVKDKIIITISVLFGILGHAFSPLLKFKGGKAVAVSFGAWSVLTKWEAPIILGSVFTLFTLIKPKGTTVGEDSLRVIIGFIFLIPYIIYKFYLGEEYLLILYIGNFSIILYKHWKDLKEYFKSLFLSQ